MRNPKILFDEGSKRLILEALGFDTKPNGAIYDKESGEIQSHTDDTTVNFNNFAGVYKDPNTQKTVWVHDSIHGIIEHVKNT